jgi:hypothetical protein
LVLNIQRGSLQKTDIAQPYVWEREGNSLQLPGKILWELSAEWLGGGRGCSATRKRGLKGIEFVSDVVRFLREWGSYPEELLKETLR